jgi:hypothetical protein
MADLGDSMKNVLKTAIDWIAAHPVYTLVLWVLSVILALAL